MALQVRNAFLSTAVIVLSLGPGLQATEEMTSGLSRCVHVSDIGDTTWNDISCRQQVCTWTR